MRPAVTAAAVIIIAVCVNTLTQKSCRDDGGKCVAMAGRSCRMLQHNTCPEGFICCARRSRKTKKNSVRRCKTSGKCRRKLGTCVSRRAGVCDSKTRDRWCRGRSCTCCLPKKQSCSLSSECAGAGGSCVSTKSARCAGHMLTSVCDHPKCFCCIPPHTCVCGNANVERIVGGVEVSPHEFPWLVGLQFNNKTIYTCGGSIINNLYILTAGHCLYDLETSQLRDPTCIRVGIADHNQASHQDDVPGVTRLVNIQGYSIHPNYNLFNITDDIALVKLAQPLDLSSHREIRSVCLPPNDNQTYQGLTATAAGWGYVTENSTTQPDVLRQAGITILDPTCQNKTVNFVTITQNMLCAGEVQGGVDACLGDSGGPLTVTQGGRHIIVGITSFGEGCARPNIPGVYTRVSKYLPWIMQNTQDATYCASLPNVKKMKAAKSARTSKKT
ncbi:trypsin-7-like [Cherax quadricarinatus]|uniref:trypsin-7-like n=1 Tax=Cherax quadricarinatus TaxID=27406 RepID=UPI00387E5950